jgi:methyl-accepting chemotaxis protein
MGRIGTRAAAIVALMLAVIAYLAWNGLVQPQRHGQIIEQMGLRDRAAIEAVDDFSTDVALLAGRRTREGAGTAAAAGAAMDGLEALTGESARLAAAIAVAMEEQQTTAASLDARTATLTRIGRSNATAAEQITVTMIDLSRLAAVQGFARGAPPADDVTVLALRYAPG